MTDDKDLLIGQKEICKFCGGVSPKTIKNWHKRRAFPVHMERGTWVASKKKIIEWTSEKAEELKKARRSRRGKRGRGHRSRGGP